MVFVMEMRVLKTVLTYTKTVLTYTKTVLTYTKTVLTYTKTVLTYTNGLCNGNARAFCGVGTEESLIII
jgi:hypothetical protein